jgi:tetratricopeptide (TPR) repeat protein
LGKQDAAALRVALDGYRPPDPVFEEEWKLLTIHCLILEAEEALCTGREIYARELLDRAEEVAQAALYFTEELSGKILLLKSRLKSADLGEICRKLPSLDEVLILRAKGALAAEEYVRALHLLESVEDKARADWNFLRGELYLIGKDYQQAAICFRKAEESLGEAVFPKMEICYRELGDYRMAYAYSCKQRNR